MPGTSRVKDDTVPAKLPEVASAKKALEPLETGKPKGKGPKVDATGATWLGLVSGTLKPWLAFTRGMVVARAGLTELRWLQQVAERLQQAYVEQKG